MSKKMQRVAVSVKHGGDIMMGIRPYSGRPLITPAEYLLLAHLHGDDAVTITARGASVHTNFKEEKDRLLATYGGTPPAQHKVDKVESLFPGAVPTLPCEFAELGIDIADHPYVGPEEEPDEGEAVEEKSAEKKTSRGKAKDAAPAATSDIDTDLD